MFDFKARHEKEMETDFPDVQPWVLSTFVSWLKDGRIRFTDGVPNEWTNDEIRSVAKRYEALTRSPKIHEDHKIIPERYHKCGILENAMQPVDLQWMKLFELYAFTDKYFCRLFGQTILEICQVKLSVKQPHPYMQPDPEDIAYLSTNLPESTPLRRLVVDVIAGNMTDNIRGDLGEKQRMNELLELPAEISAQVTISSAKRAKALACCASQSSGCHLNHHGPDDSLHALDRDWCFYHDHQDDEKDICKERRRKLKGFVVLRKDRFDEAKERKEAAARRRQEALDSIPRAYRVQR